MKSSHKRKTKEVGKRLHHQSPHKSPVKGQQQQQQKQKEDHADAHDPRANIPFNFATDAILLVGEGDLSFARSLVAHHGAVDMTATTFDSADELATKYPQAAGNISAMRAEFDMTAGTPVPGDGGGGGAGGGDDDFPEGLSVLHGVDATRLAAHKALRTRRFDRIVFNFPHVGGLSTDVNRQVRANQALLVGFFSSAAPLLRRPTLGAEGGEEQEGEATVVVTLFEGEPYSLWNVRDLARHSGFEVVRSLRFEASRYPGYEHRRTLGNIEGGRGWRGEDREARMFIFRLKDQEGRAVGRGVGKRKRAGGEESSDED